MGKWGNRMFFRTIRWMRYAIVTLFLFNLLQSLIFKVDTTNPVEVMAVNGYGDTDTLNEKVVLEGSSTEKVFFVVQKEEGAKETIRRSGLLTTRPNAKGTILLCHGYMCNKFDIGFLRTFFPDYNCMLFDFRAHGENRENQVCTFGKDEAFDIIGAVSFLRKHQATKDHKIIGYGFSMGASSLIEAQAKKNDLFSGLILDCPFESTETVLDKVLASYKFNLLGWKIGLPGKNLIKNLAFNKHAQPIVKLAFKMMGMDATKINTRFERVNPIESVHKVTIPCLFIHCKNDTRIPVGSVKKLFAKARGFKNMWLTKGRGHCDSFIFNPEKYQRITNSFLAKLLSGRLLKSEENKIEEDL